MSTYGFPDGQQITQWLGQPLAEATAAPIGAGTISKGPFALANFASVIVAVHPTGGSVIVKVTQSISGGPGSLSFTQTFTATPGETLFQAVVLLADQITIELDGGGVGTTVDYAVYPSNSTTNTQAIVSASINFLHNDVLVAAEPGIDLEDALGFVWTLTDDAANGRMRVTPPSPALMLLQDVVVGAGGAAAISFTGIPATATNLALELSVRSTTAAANDFLLGHLNSDTGANYDNAGGELLGTGAVPTFIDEYGAGRVCFGLIPGATVPASEFSGHRVELLEYANTNKAKAYRYEGSFLQGAHASPKQTYIWGSGSWYPAGLAAVSQIDLFANAGSFAQYSRARLYAEL